jgi:CSLREA domain-containing protein
MAGEHQVRLRLLVIIALIMAVLLHPESVQAATFVVSTTDDAPHASPVNASCTSTLPGNPCTLRAAVQAANFLGGANTINLGVAGTYTLTSGQLTLTASITIMNTSGGTVVLSGNNTGRVFQINSGFQVAISGVTIRDGNADFGGGGINVSGASLTLNDLILTSNTAKEGGAIYNDSTSTLTMSSVTIRHNISTGTFGGGLFNSGTTRADMVTITDNSAAYGGGIANEGGRLELTNADISNNTTINNGGGIDNGNGGALTARKVKINNNTARAGGGMANFDTATLTDVALSGNSATSVGGGVANENGAALTFNSSTIDNNTTNEGGGFHNGARSNLTLTNVTISGNLARINGGGIDNINNSAVTLTNTTITNNTAIGGGAVHNLAAVILKNTIIANSSIGSNCQGSATPPVTSQGSNLDSGHSCGLTAVGDLSDTDPRLGPLADNGGFTQTHTLLPGSPAINAVVNPCPPPATDQRGTTRPQATRCDIGAVELAIPLGDINGDGIVDIRDYGLWRQSFGQTNCGNPSDLNSDCIVDIRDYGIWRQHFGETAPGPLRHAPRQRPSRLYSG